MSEKTKKIDINISVILLGVIASNDYDDLFEKRFMFFGIIFKVNSLFTYIFKSLAEDEVSKHLGVKHCLNHLKRNIYQ